MARSKSLPAPDFLRNLKPVGITRDPTFPGFGVRTTPAGTKSWVYDYGRLMTLGFLEDLTYEAAREKARAARQQRKDGLDPMEERDKKRNEPVVDDLITYWQTVYRPKLRPRTADEYDGQIRLYIKPRFGKRKYKDLKRADFIALHGEISKRAETRADRVLTTTARIIQVNIDDERVAGPNPASRIERNGDHPRNPSLTAEELQALLAALDEVRPGHEDADAASNAVIKLAMSTGSRSGEIYAAVWDHIDLRKATWARPPSSVKQKDWHFLPLNSEALSQLVGLHQRAETEAAATGRPISPWVFPSRNSDSGHLTNIRRSWRRALKMAGLQQRDLRIHDLRHLFASHLVSSGVGLPIVGSLLGHRLARTTQRYAHVALDAGRLASERYASFVAGLTNGEPPAEVTGMPQRRRGAGE
jgi:integrase